MRLRGSITNAIAILTSSFVLAGCSGTLPELGANAPNPKKDGSGTRVTIAPPSPPSGDAIEDYYLTVRRGCTVVRLEAIEQQETVQRVAVKRKQGGLLLTTGVGVAGSIVTAIFAGGSSTSGEPDKPATIAGAATAGATGLAGVIALFVVGGGADNTVKRLADMADDVAKTESALDQACAPATGSRNGDQCRVQSKNAEATCDTYKKQLPYAPR